MSGANPMRARVIRANQTMLAWHVAQTKPMGELRANERLSNQGFACFLPLCRTSRVIRGYRASFDRPYIPGYLFVHFDVEDPSWRLINSAPGVQQVMYCSPEKPATVRQDVMDVLLERCNGQYVRESDLDDVLRVFWRGAAIRLNDVAGAMEGWRGTVVSSTADRVRMLMSFLGATREIEVPKQACEMVHSGGAQ